MILDITRPEHVESLADRIASDPDGRSLRALVDNAGVSVNAPVEALPLDEWRRLYDINLFDHIAPHPTVRCERVSGLRRRSAAGSRRRRR